MPITLNELTQIPELRTHFLCGDQQSDVTVVWAHVCELSNPAEWLGRGDLVMTTGIGIPQGQVEQREYIERLHAGGVAGLVIGESMQAPADISNLLAAAACVQFPVLLTAYEVPFSAISKAVLNAHKQLEADRRNAVTRVYETARLSFQGMGLARLIARLEQDVEASLFLIEPQSLAPWQSGLATLSQQRFTCVHQRPRAVRNSAVVQRVAGIDEELLAISVPAQRPCMLVACSATALDYGLLHHIVAVITVELEREQLHREIKMRNGCTLLEDLLSSKIIPRRARQELEDFGADVNQLRLCVANLSTVENTNIDWVLAQQNIDVIIKYQGSEAIFLAWDMGTIRAFQSHLNVKIGVSDYFADVDLCVDALREARLALAHATEANPVSYYSHNASQSPWLPQSLQDATEAFRQVLGSLLEYDSAQGGQLLHTLRLFLENNRSWINTSKKLHIHKQTLVYRMHRIEEITGRSLDSTDDVAILWFAVKSAEIAGIECGHRTPNIALMGIKPTNLVASALNG